MKRFTAFALLLLFCCLHLLTMDETAQTISKTELSDDVELKMTNHSLYINQQVITENAGSMGGKVLWFSLKDGHQFILSTNPHTGYDFKRAGKIVGNVISFWHDNNYYEWRSTELIVSDGIEVAPLLNLYASNGFGTIICAQHEWTDSRQPYCRIVFQH